MSLLRTRLMVFTAAVAGTGALLFASPALAANLHVTSAPRAAAQASSTHESLTAEIKAQLRYNPSGKVIGPGEISYDRGHVVVILIRNTNCASGYVCLWEDANYSGPQANFNTPTDKNIPIHGYIPEVDSLKNNFAHGAILSNGTGGTVCYPQGAHAPNISSPFRGYPYLYLQHLDNC
jgi:Peptidase inhibitor family I36